MAKYYGDYFPYTLILVDEETWDETIFIHEREALSGAKFEARRGTGRADELYQIIHDNLNNTIE